MEAWPEAHVIWVLLQADDSHWYSVTQQVQHVPGFLPWMPFRRPPMVARTTRPSRTWSTGVGMFHRPLLEAATYHRYIVTNTCSNRSICPPSFPQTYNVTPFKWLKMFNRSMYSSAGHCCDLEWMLQTLFTSQSTTVTVCRVKTEGAKIGLLSVIRSPMTVTNESLTLHPLSMHIIYPRSNEHSLWGSCIFSGSALRKNIFLSFFVWYLPSPMGFTTQIPICQMPIGENRLWARTLDRCTRASHPVICYLQNARPPPETK